MKDIFKDFTHEMWDKAYHNILLKNSKLKKEIRHLRNELKKALDTIKELQKCD